MARRGFFRRIIDRIIGTAPPPRQPPSAPPHPPAPTQWSPPEDEEVFTSDGSVKNQVKLTKVQFYGLDWNFGRRQSDAYVDRSNRIDLMQEVLEPDNKNEYTWSELASLASKAHNSIYYTGDAGELAIYLPYSFLWYHYLPSKVTEWRKCTKSGQTAKHTGTGRQGMHRKPPSSESTAREWAVGPLTVTYSSASGIGKSRIVKVSLGETALTFCTNNTGNALTESILASFWVTISRRSSRDFQRIAPAISSPEKE